MEVISNPPMWQPVTQSGGNLTSTTSALLSPTIGPLSPVSTTYTNVQTVSPQVTMVPSTSIIYTQSIAENSLRSLLDEKHREGEMLKRECFELRERLNESQRVIRPLQGENELLKREQQAQSERMAVLVSERIQMELHVSNHKQQLGIMETQISKTRAEMSHVEQLLVNVQQENLELGEMLNRTRDDNAKLLLEIQARDQEIKLLKDDLAAATPVLNDLRKQLEVAVMELGPLRQEVPVLRNDNKIQAAEIERLKAEIERLQQQLKERKEKVSLKASAPAPIAPPKMCGVGMLLGKFDGSGDRRGKVYVLKLVPGGPAGMCGQIQNHDATQPEDILHRVDSNVVDGWELDQVFKVIRGPEGSPVTLEFGRMHGSQESRYRLTLFRQDVSANAQAMDRSSESAGSSSYYYDKPNVGGDATYYGQAYNQSAWARSDEEYFRTAL
eukprot:765988-Hanusia_phi.AAC.4